MGIVGRKEIWAGPRPLQCLGLCEKITLLNNSLYYISGGPRRCDVIEDLKESQEADMIFIQRIRR